MKASTAMLPIMAMYCMRWVSIPTALKGNGYIIIKYMQFEIFSSGKSNEQLYKAYKDGE